MGCMTEWSKTEQFQVEAYGFGIYLIVNTCGWMQKTRLYQDSNNMKHTTSENT